jgi:hypothetical protein
MCPAQRWQQRHSVDLDTFYKNAGTSMESEFKIKKCSPLGNYDNQQASVKNSPVNPLKEEIPVMLWTSWWIWLSNAGGPDFTFW